MIWVKGGSRSAEGGIVTACRIVAAVIFASRCALCAEPAAGLTDPSPAAHAKFRSVGMAEAKWTHGFWADRLETCRTNTLPALGKIMLDADPNNPGPSQYLNNFRIASGAVEGRHRGASFNDGDLYKWLEAVAAIYAVTKDAQLDRTMDEVIETIAEAQRSDGYLQTDVIISGRQGDKTIQPFTVPTKFEAYNLGHLLTAACVHYRATGKNSLLDVARKAANYLDSLVDHPTPQFARCAICPSHYMGTIELYRATGDKRYLNLAKKLIDLRDLIPDGTDDNQDRIPFRRQREAVGHAVRANYLYAGAADVYAETGDETLLTALAAIWDDVVHKKMYVTGACGALFDGASPDGSKEQSQISRVHQAYGRDYQLPNSTAHNETCAAIGNVLWNWRMLEITGDAKYADVLELTLCNAVLAGQSLDGRTFFYTNTLRQLDTMPVTLRWSRTRQGYFSSFCCPPNLARTIAEASNYAYSKTDLGIAVNLYGSNTLETTVGGERLKLTQEADYPWDGAIKITIEAAPKDACTIALRIPGWAKDASISIAGNPVTESVRPGTYFEINRLWAQGNVIELKVPMAVRLIEANPLVEEARNQVSVQRGPLVYCLESPDLPEGIQISDVAVAAGIELTPKFDPNLLGGAVTLTGSAVAVAEPKWTADLYRDLPAKSTRKIDIKLIPYFAWSNRGKSEMSVWLPLAR
jgi:uncharacterized protein